MKPNYYIPPTDGGGIAFAEFPENPFGERDVFIRPNAASYYRANPETQIFVKSNLMSKSDGGHRLAFREKNAAHPDDGEAFVAGFEPVAVALTVAVCEALGTGEIVECSNGEVDAYAKAKLAKTRKHIQDQKEFFRLNFIALVGTDAGFETAWETIHAKTALNAVLTEN